MEASDRSPDRIEVDRDLANLERIFSEYKAARKVSLILAAIAFRSVQFSRAIDFEQLGKGPAKKVDPQAEETE